MVAKLLIFSRLCKNFTDYFFYFTSIYPLLFLYITSTYRLSYLNGKRIVRDKRLNSIVTAGFWDAGSLKCVKFSREFMGFLTVKSREGATFVINSLENSKERRLKG